MPLWAFFMDSSNSYKKLKNGGLFTLKMKNFHYQNRKQFLL